MILIKSDGAVVTCSAAALRRSPESLVVTDEIAAPGWSRPEGGPILSTSRVSVTWPTPSVQDMPHLGSLVPLRMQWQPAY